MIFDLPTDMSVRSQRAGDRATELAKKALAEIRRIDTMYACLGRDPTEAQELTISIAIRNYFIEETKAMHRETRASIDRGLAMVREKEPAP
jgi:hypothetical protein